MSTIQVADSAKQPEKYALSDSTVSLAFKFCELNLKKFTSIFQILSAIFTNILCLVKCLFEPKIQMTLMNQKLSYYPRPMYPGKH